VAISWNADSVFATSGSYRGGAYMKRFTSRRRAESGGAPWRGAGIAARVGDDHRNPVFNVYAQTISLETVALTAGQQLFSERRRSSCNVIYPRSNVPRLVTLRPSLIGAVNGRF